MKAADAGRRLRMGFRRFAIGCFILLLPIAAHALWDYVESRRLFAAIDDLRQRGEPVSSVALGRWQRPTDEDEIRAARYYNSAGELAFHDWIANLPNQQPIQRARADYAAVAQSHALTPDAASRAEALLTEYAESLEMMDRAAALPFTRFPPHDFEDYVRTYSLENLALVASARTLLLAFRGDGDSAARALWSSLKLRRAHTRTVPWVSEPMIDLQFLLETTRPSRAMLVQLQDAFRERERPDAVERELRERRAMLLESMFRDWYGRRADPLIPAANVRWTWRPAAPLRPWAAHQMTGILRLSQRAVDAAVRPWPTKLEVLAAIAATQEGPTRNLRPAIVDHGRSIIRGMGTEGAARHAATLARVRSAIAALAVERFRRDHAGRTPAGLSELVPTYLDAVPQDPFSGQPLRYRFDGGRFIIYGVGHDGKDDGGDVAPMPVHAWRVTTKDVGVDIRMPAGPSR